MIKELLVEKSPDSFDEMKAMIEGMEVNVRYMMPETFRYKWIKIELEKEYGSDEFYYCWAMEWNYAVTGCVSYVYPMKGYSSFVASFKTELGAKRNLIKRFEKIFKKPV